MSEPTREAWAHAFAFQARSDWATFRLLSDHAEVPACHRLHYLQMACEKLAKAFRCRDTEAKLEDLLARHVGFTKFIGAYLASPQIKQDYAERAAQLQGVTRRARQLGREIELLAPAVDRVGRPSNAEYPWANGEGVIAPCEHSFPNLAGLQEPGGVTFLKLIERAMAEV